MKLAEISFSILLIFLFSCTPAGGLKPSIYTNPISYLENFPLNKVTESEMIKKSGPPNRTAELDGKKMLVYELGEGYGERTFSYILLSLCLS